MDTRIEPDRLYKTGGFWDWCDTLSLPVALVVIVTMVGVIWLL